MHDYFPEEAEMLFDYTKHHRQPGQGPLRLGQPLQANEDIYALLFASCFKLEIIDLHRWEAEKNEEAV
jgi:hypothetical protein